MASPSLQAVALRAVLDVKLDCVLVYSPYTVALLGRDTLELTDFINFNKTVVTLPSARSVKVVSYQGGHYVAIAPMLKMKMPSYAAALQWADELQPAAIAAREEPHRRLPPAASMQGQYPLLSKPAAMASRVSEHYMFTIPMHMMGVTEVATASKRVFLTSDSARLSAALSSTTFKLKVTDV